MLPLLRRLRPAAVALGPILVVCLPAAGRAADGVLEINQACATQTGCFAGDVAGFPVTIGAAAPATSFRLTGDLTVATADTTAIFLQRDGARIDLGGFAIRGPVSCSGAPLVCAPNGAGDGIGVDDPEFRERVTVRNGEVRGMGRYGLQLGTGSIVEDVHASQNGQGGISTYGESMIRGSQATRNGSWGILASSGSVVEGCNAIGNQADGIYAGNHSVVIGNTTHGNGRHGIDGGLDSVVQSNAAFQNGERGISVARATISGNTASFNKGPGIVCAQTCLVSGNSVGQNGLAGVGDGIECSNPGCSVRGNTSSHNAARGLKLHGQSTYRENTMVGNVLGAVSGGTNLGDNFCNGAGVVSASCP